MKAVIMAGGEGTRLRPLTSRQPKPMMPLANRPMMEHVIRLLRTHGFEEIVVTVAFLANAIRTYFGDGSEFGVQLIYANEETPLGTAGSVRNAMDELRDETFLVISGDVLTDIDLTDIVGFHQSHQATATIALKAMEDPLEFGIVITGNDGAVERFLEKPTWGQVFSDTINTGIYVLEPTVFDFIDEGRSVDFAADVFPRLLAQGLPVYGDTVEGYWEDVGTLEAYVHAHQDVLDRKVDLDVPGFDLGHGVWLGDGAEVHPDARLDGPAVIGDNCRVEAGAHVREYTVLGDNVHVGPDTYLERVVVHDNTYLGAGVRLRGCVVGRSCDLRSHARCEEGVVLGDECFIGEHAIVNPGVKVYPGKIVEAGAVVNSSIVWESRAARHLFGQFGVSGLANVDISPEHALRVAMAYATSLPKGSVVATSRDSSRAARTLKRAVMVGLNAAGVDVDDLEAATVPVTRFQVRSQRRSGGITVRLHPEDPGRVVIRFFDANGVDLDEGSQRKVERLFYREDFRRARGGDIGDIGFPPRALEFYTAALMATVEEDAVRNAGFKVVLDYSYGSTSFVMPSVLAKLGADVLAVNPYAATARAVEADRTTSAATVGALVRSARADLGAVIDRDGERLTLIDDQGRTLSDDQATSTYLMLLSDGRTNGEAPDKHSVALPISASSHLVSAAEDRGAQVVLAKLSGAGLMDAATAGGAVFASDLSGGYAFPAFLPAFDATAAFVHLLDLLTRRGPPLSKVADEAPVTFVVRDSTPTPWEHKGLVMRTLVESAPDDHLVLIDGVKVMEEGGWVLALPDPEEPVTRLWAEGTSPADARRRIDRLADQIRQLLAPFA